VLTPLLVGFEKAGDLPFASSLCAACTEVCPVRIPLHEHLIALRRDVMAKERPMVQMGLFRLWAAAWRTPLRFRLFIRMSRVAQRLFVRRARIPRAPFPLSRWTGGRDLPPMARETFRERWVARRRAGRPDGSEDES